MNNRRLPPPSSSSEHHHIPTSVSRFLKMDLQPLLVALMSDNNDIRQQAEKSLNDEWLENAPDSLLLQLAKQTRVGETDTVRVMYGGSVDV